MKLSKDMLRKIRIEMNAALAVVVRDNGLSKLEATNCSFDPSGSFSFKVEGVTAGGLDKDAARYENEREAFGFPPLGTELKGGYGKITGMKSGGKVCFTKPDGRRMVMAQESLSKYI